MVLRAKNSEILETKGDQRLCLLSYLQDYHPGPPSHCVTCQAWVQQVQMQPVTWQKWRSFNIYCLRFSIRFLFLWSCFSFYYAFLSLFSLNAIWELQEFLYFKKYELSIYQMSITRGRKWISSCQFSSFICLFFIHSASKYLLTTYIMSSIVGSMGV